MYDMGWSRVSTRDHDDLIRAIEDVTEINRTQGQNSVILEGNPSVSEWMSKNPLQALKLTSIHEFVQALLCVSSLDRLIAQRARALWQLSRATYPHVPEGAPVALLLMYLIHPAGLEDYEFYEQQAIQSAYRQGFEPPSRQFPLNTYRALRTLAGFQAAHSTAPCSYISAANVYAEYVNRLPRVREHQWPPYDWSPRPTVPFDWELELDNVLGHERCECIDSDDRSFESRGSTEELRRVLRSKGLTKWEMFVHKPWLGRVEQLSDNVWVWGYLPEVDDIRGKIASSGWDPQDGFFELRIEPSEMPDFDEVIALAFRVRSLDGQLRFGVPAGNRGTRKIDWPSVWSLASEDLRNVMECIGGDAAGDPTIVIDYDEITGSCQLTVNSPGHPFHNGLRLDSLPALIGSALTVARTMP